ncbi:hypothetical protein [Micromonospora profundi]|uniref:hypothetical protein n=1 Tax=Micromonospora TaxID=1873 RepID=UPI0033B0C9D9
MSTGAAIATASGTAGAGDWPGTAATSTASPQSWAVSASGNAVQSRAMRRIEPTHGADGCRMTAACG